MFWIADFRRKNPQDSFVNLQGDKARFSLSISKDGKVYFQYDGKSKEKELSNQFLGTSLVSLIPLAPLSLVGFYM